MDARDSVDGLEDTIGSAKPPRPPKPARDRDPERFKLVLLQVIAAGVVATAVFAGITAWETHQHRATDKALYCTAYADDSGSGDAEYDKQQQALRDALDC
jgi:hypothetical protein